MPGWAKPHNAISSRPAGAGRGRGPAVSLTAAVAADTVRGPRSRREPSGCRVSWQATIANLPSIEVRPGRLFGLLWVALAPVAVFAPGGTVVLLAAAALVLAASGPARRATLRLGAQPPAVVLIAFLAWAAVASLWAPDPGRSLFLAARCALLFAGGLVLAAAAAEMAAAERRQAIGGLIAGGALLLALLVFEEATGALLTRLLRGLDAAGLETATKGAPLARGATLLALFAWPVLLAATRRLDRRLAAATVPAIVVVLYAQATDTPILAFTLAAAAFGVVYAWPRPALALLFAGLAVVVAVAPLLAAQLPAPAEAAGWVADLPASWRQRVEIWRFTAERIAERPLLGWGFDSARALGDPMSLHPHDFALQVWLELGAPGVLLALAFAALLWRRLGAWAADRAAVGAAAAALTAYLVFALLSRGAWQEWWLAAAWLLAAALVVTAPPSQQPGRRSSAPRP